MAIRVKAVKKEKKGTGETARAVVRVGGAQKKSRQIGVAKVMDGESKSSRVSERARMDEVGFGVIGMGKTWSLHASIESTGRDRCLAAPPLPVPIASFTI